MKSFILVLFLCCISSICTLPVRSKYSKEIRVKNDHVIKSAKEEKDCYLVQVDRLAQLITTHIQFDHLDTVISNTDNFIATEFQHHLEINVLTNNHKKVLSNLDMIDLEILKSQIFAAIHAHTEGNLPLVWNMDKLSKQAIESFIRQILLSTCATYGNTDTVPSTCLQKNAVKLAKQLDSYIYSSLDHIFDTLDKETLPNLLKHTAADLKGILKYFNLAFLQDGSREFVLQVTPWNSDPNDIHNFKSKLLDLAIHTSTDNLEIPHSTAFFIEFTSMAKL